MLQAVKFPRVCSTLGGEADFVVHVFKLLMLLSGVDFGCLLLCSQGIHSTWCQVRLASIIFGIQDWLTLFAGKQTCPPSFQRRVRGTFRSFSLKKDLSPMFWD
jgi:hypothetical protein